jgi:TPP-dependent pyruvate/acetoin dehydrogenase alpha subunit
MNMAAIWRLPVLFICENNGFGEFTATEDVTAGADPLARGQAFAIPSETIERARNGGGPSFLVCNTYRYGGHHAGDKQDYKHDAEAKAWRLKDPIEKLDRWLRDSKLATAATIDALKREIDQEVRAAVELAKQAPLPAADDFEAHLYA